jgi:hypothetical protein
MSGMPTHDATELSLRAAVAAFRMPTGVASLAAFSRIDKRNRHANKSRLVANELPQLSKGPIAVSCSLRFPNRRPRANVRQIFQRNRPLRAFGLRNKLLCNAMVCILLKAVLFTRQLSQMAFGRETTALL